MFKKWYIHHVDLQTPENGEAYFGPFRRSEIGERVNDAYADLLAGCGNVDSVKLGWWETRKMYINSASYWYHQLSECTRPDIPEPYAIINLIRQIGGPR